MHNVFYNGAEKAKDFSHPTHRVKGVLCGPIHICMVQHRMLYTVDSGYIGVEYIG